jgi:hypothetical protein
MSERGPEDGDLSPDCGPWELVTWGAPMRGRADEYADRSINARLAAALLAVESWLGHVGLYDPEIRNLLEHLWARPTVRSETFDEWEGYDSEVLAAALGGDLPERLELACRSRHVPPGELACVLEDVVEIVYTNLFGTVVSEDSLKHLRRLEQTVGRYGIELVAAGRFADEPLEAGHGEGRERSEAEVGRWREYT